MQYSLSDNLTPSQFEELRLSGDINPNATYQDYLELHRERATNKREAEEATRRDGYELGAPELELTLEDEMILDRAWAEVAAEKAVRERERLPRVAESTNFLSCATYDMPYCCEQVHSFFSQW